MKIILLMLLLYIQLNRVVIAEFRPKSCCLEVSKTKVQVGDLLDYYIQTTPLCPLRAILFLTRRNITVCSNPEDNWAKRAMKAIDARKTPKPPLGPPMCITSTSTRIPTTSIKTPGPETKTSSRTVTSISTDASTVTTFKTPGPETKTSSRTVTSISTDASTVTTFKTPGPETKTSSRTVTSISTAPSTVTTFKTTGLQTTIRTTSTKPDTVSTETSQSPLSSAKQCTEPNHSTGTSHKPSGKDTEAPRTTFTSTTKARTTRKKTLLKIIQRKRGKSKKQLRKYQSRG